MTQEENSQYLMLFGKRIEELRKLQGLTKVQLAFEMGTGEKYIRRLEKGEINITLMNMRKLSSALNIPLHELIFFRDTSNEVQSIDPPK